MNWGQNTYAQHHLPPRISCRSDLVVTLHYPGCIQLFSCSQQPLLPWLCFGLLEWIDPVCKTTSWRIYFPKRAEHFPTARNRSNCSVSGNFRWAAEVPRFTQTACLDRRGTQDSLDDTKLNLQRNLVRLYHLWFPLPLCHK